MLFKYIRLYIEFFKQNIKIMLEYRADFIIGAMASLFMQMSGIFFVWVIFKNVTTLQGWTFYDITLVYGLLMLSKSLNHIFFDNLWVLGPQYIRQGNFDTLLLRPISPLFHLIANRLQQDGIGNFLLGLVITVKSLYELNLNLGIKGVALIILFVVSGGAIFAAINLITATSSFWVVNSYHLIWTVYSVNEFALYPLNIYHKAIGIILTWVIPYAFASFYPANYFIHKGYEQLSFISPIVALVLWVIALRVWRFGIKNYTSTGS
ncbi:MAG: ABC-2 family transporter protein [Clostridia bacterium]|nr:ABC-2 family transporter protein [Clostridia bacterium]